MPKKKSESVPMEESSSKKRRNPSRKAKQKPKYFEEEMEFSEEEGGYEDEVNESEEEKRKTSKKKMRKKGGKTQKEDEQKQPEEPVSNEEEKDKKLEAKEPAKVEVAKEGEDVVKPAGDVGDQPIATTTVEEPNLVKEQPEKITETTEQKDLDKNTSVQDKSQDSSVTPNLVLDQPTSQ